MKKFITTLALSFIICMTLASCDTSLLNDLISPEHTHEYDEWIVQKKVNCLRDGTEIRTCECGEIEEREIKSPGHIPGEWTVEKESTCTEEGMKTNKCVTCSKPLGEEAIPTADHSYQKVSTFAPTCTYAGYTLNECTVCGIETSTDRISALGHQCDNYDRYNFDATASLDGTVSGVCTRCGKDAKKTLPGSSILLSNAFSGINISVLGDSISTYYGVTDGDAADTTNSTIRDSVLYYDETHAKALGVTRENTWWQLTADSIGAEILVNNSWSGSFILDTSTNTRPTPGAYLDRCVNLHDDTGANAGTKPDIILVYLGTNDYYKYKANCGSASSVDYGTLSEKLGADYVPTSVAEAYAIMLYKMKEAYPNAEIYCLNILESKSSDTSLASFNDMIGGVAQSLNCKYIDICENSSIKNNTSYENYVPSNDGDNTPNGLHPNSSGMHSIADCVIDAIVRESKYAPDFDILIKN